MRICLYLDRSKTMLWHKWLVQTLTKAGHTVSVRFSPKQAGMPRAYTALFAIEKITYNLCKGNSAIDQIGPDALPRGLGDEPFDVVVCLTMPDNMLPAHRRTLIPRYNGAPTVFGAIEALLNSQKLTIDVWDSAHRDPVTAFPAITDRDVLVHSLDSILSCMIALIAKSLSIVSSGENSGRTGTDVRLPPATRAYMYSAGRVLDKAGRYLRILTAGQRTWSVAWRRDDVSLLVRGTAQFKVLPNSKGHYYADPFPFHHNEFDYIFVEDFSFATGRACISVATIVDNDVTTPIPVLDTGYHLSFPHVFSYNNEIYMVPESGDTRDIYLYRATRFPHTWICEGPLMRDIDGYDAIIVLPRGNQPFWLFLAERVWKSTGWDILNLFHSDRLVGADWKPHREGNPMLLDARYSRPAGAIFERDGRLIRPVQDCSQLYGGAVQLCEIEKLDTTNFTQRLIGTINCKKPDGQLFRGCHTYNFARGIETIDVFDRGVGETVTAFFRPAEANPLDSIEQRKYGAVCTPQPFHSPAVLPPPPSTSNIGSVS